MFLYLEFPLVGREGTQGLPCVCRGGGWAWSIFSTGDQTTEPLLAMLCSEFGDLLLILKVFNPSYAIQQLSTARGILCCLVTRGQFQKGSLPALLYFSTDSIFSRNHSFSGKDWQHPRMTLAGNGQTQWRTSEKR